MTLEAYLEALRPLASTGQKRRVWYGLGLLLSGALELLLYAEVAAQLVYPMPRQAANYLLQTMFWRFSLTELNSLLAASGSSSLLIPLTVIYWSSLFLIFPIAFFLAAVLKPVGGRKLFLYQRQILDVRE